MIFFIALENFGHSCYETSLSPILMTKIGVDLCPLSCLEETTVKVQLFFIEIMAEESEIYPSVLFI